MSPYRIAIDRTTQTIDMRAKYFRNLVVAVVLIGVGSIGCTAVARALSPLSGFFLLLPLCGFYFFLDGELVNDWRSKLLQSWTNRELDFRGFCEAVGAIPRLPKDTVQSILATLPPVGDLVAEQAISSRTRETIAASVTTIHMCRTDAIAFKTAGYAIAAISLIVAATLRTWTPLLGFVALTPLPLLRRQARLWRLEDLRERTVIGHRHGDFNEQKCIEILARLPWEPVLVHEKDKFIMALRSAA